MPFTTFELSAQILRAIQRRGYTAPTPVQLRTIPPMLARRDILACAQTGTGKTAAFALPILHLLLATAGSRPRSGTGGIRALVLSPTRELAAQIEGSFRAYGCFTPLRMAAVYGGVASGPQVKALQGGLDVLVATPGRLIDLMEQGWVKLGAVETLVLDEADRMLDMGFLPDVRRVISRLPAERQTALFSATMPPPIEHLARTILHDPVRISITASRTTRPSIDQSVYFVTKADKLRFLTRLLSIPGVARALVFTRTKRGADRVAVQLNRSGIRAAAMHGDKTQATRQRILAEFKSHNPPVLVATDLAARGIDVTGVSHVVNYELPEEPETYVHRIGRTARAGAAGIAISLCDQAEQAHLRAIQTLIRQQIPQGAELAVARGAPPPAPYRESPHRVTRTESEASGIPGAAGRTRSGTACAHRTARRRPVHRRRVPGRRRSRAL
jgi:ATP-dependent RNA helicase RhlE